MYRDIVYTVYLLDCWGEYHTAQLLFDYYCIKIEVSFFSLKRTFFEKCSWGSRTQKQLRGGGGVAGEKVIFHYKICFLKNVPGVLKHQENEQNKMIF